MRLRRSDPAGPGIVRRRSGRGWRYTDADGEPVDKETRERIDGLVIPPAWREVWISPVPHGHIQAVGIDAAGRRQYLYHEQWRVKRDAQKHNRVLELVSRLPEFRSAIGADLGGRGLTCARVHAGALRMLDRGVFRTGGEEYADENGSRGVATLLREDVAVSKGDLVFCFPAKGGIERNVRIRDDKLVKLIRSLQRVDHHTDRLLVYREGRSDWHEVHADSINARFKELTGDDYTVKDLRTWNATVVAAMAFAKAPKPTSQRGRERSAAAVLDEVAEQLGNTRAVARRSYVDPRVVAAFDRGETIEPDLTKRADIEKAVLELLA
ncbi:MAG: DNA topoisomerase IB [Kibdelosporangium sp.]